jgi:hypothetical protein
MSCPQLYFQHTSGTGLTTDISIDTQSIIVGQFSDISVTLRNAAIVAGLGQVKLYWCPVVAGAPSGTPTPLNLAGCPNPIPPETIPGVEGWYTWNPPLQWCPDASVVPPAGTDPFHIALMGCAIAPAVVGVCPNGVSHPGDFDWFHLWNGAQIFQYG